MPENELLDKPLCLPNKLLGNRVFVLQDPAQEVTESGIYLPNQEPPRSGIVVAVGEGKLMQDGKHVPVPVERGDHVLYAKYSAAEVIIRGSKFQMLEADSIICVL